MAQDIEAKLAEIAVLLMKAHDLAVRRLPTDEAGRHARLEALDGAVAEIANRLKACR